MPLDFTDLYWFIKWFILFYTNKSGARSAPPEAPRAPLLGTVLLSTTGSAASTEGTEAATSLQSGCGGSGLSFSDVEALWASVQYYWLFIVLLGHPLKWDGTERIAYTSFFFPFTKQSAHFSRVEILWLIPSNCRAATKQVKVNTRERHRSKLNCSSGRE